MPAFLTRHWVTPGIQRLRVPAVMLLAFLQQTPAVRLAAEAADAVLESPLGAVIKAAAATLAALGAVDSVAGATQYELTTGIPGHPSPYTVVQGSQIEGVEFALMSNPQTSSFPGSWDISGSIPPGLVLSDQIGDNLTTPGILDTPNPILTGTPTAPGTFMMFFQAFQGTELSGMFSSVLEYEVIVTPEVTPPPTPTPTPTPTPSADAPVFTTQPISVIVTGGTVALDAAASNGPTYQWMLNGSTPVAGATNATLLLGDAASAAGTYTCVATNASGSATSNPATVAVAGTLDPGRLINLSARAEVGTGANIIFAGFVSGGAGTAGSQSLLVRASGPAIAAAPFNVPGTLPDPQLQVFNSAQVAIATNDGWGGTAQLVAAAAAVHAFAWNDPASHDAALDLSLAPGAYTAQVAGQSGDTGDALAEVYDATPSGTYVISAPRLINLAARVDVGSGSNALFAGFVIGGSTSLTVLIRASGPAIAVAPFNVGGTLPDPELTLQNPSTQAVIAANDGWGGNPEISSTAAAVHAFAWNEPTSHDSALLITLPPGAYTAAATGASGDTGVAIVEVYEVP